MDSEKIVKEFLENKGLRVDGFSKHERKNIKTPDFKVFTNSKLAFYCEVKNSQEDLWLDKQLNDAKPGVIVGGKRNDPIYNRFASHIHKASKQFLSVNKDHSIPNVLAFYNEDSDAGFIDILSVITGNAYCESGNVHPIFKNFSEGRLKTDIKIIDMILWVDKYKPCKFFFLAKGTKTIQGLCEYFDYDINQIKYLKT